MGGCGGKCVRWEGVEKSARDGRVWREVRETGGCGEKCERWEGVKECEMGGCGGMGCEV